MISQADKLGLLKDFLASDFYCDMRTKRVAEEITTIRETLTSYLRWGADNIEDPSDNFKAAVVVGRQGITECIRLLRLDDFTDLTELDRILAELRVIVDKLVAG